MEKEVFAHRFQEATRELLKLCRPMVDGVLPDVAVFKVKLNCSYDRNADPVHERTYPQDRQRARDPALRECSEQVIKILTTIPDIQDSERMKTSVHS